MDVKKTALNKLNWQIFGKLCLGFIMMFAARISQAYTNPGDVAAINSLYTALGSPLLPGWVAVGGDPCADGWQGVQCIDSNINSIVFNAANLGGELGDSLGSFESIRSIDFSGNQIGGNIPSILPITLQNLFLSDNKFTGSIPSSFSSLSQLSAMSLDNNQLTGEIPDSFQGLTVLVNLELSHNNLSGQLPPSLGSLSSLTTFHLQNNQFSGTLDVLQDLPLQDLNVAYNMFSGPIPEKLLSIPKFINDGNPFNTSNSPLSPPTLPGIRPPVPPIFGVPSSSQTPGKQRPRKQSPSKPADGPSTTEDSNSKQTGKTLTTKKIIWISIASVLSFLILVLLLLLFIPKCCRRSVEANRIPKRHEIAPYTGNRENTGYNESLIQPINHNEKVPKVPVVKLNGEQPTRPRSTELAAEPLKEELNVQSESQTIKHEDHDIKMTRIDIDSIRPPPPPPSVPLDQALVRPNLPAEIIPVTPSTRPLPPTSVKCYTIASLQQYTNSFSQENLIGEGMLGSTYRAQLPNGKILAVKKLDKRASNQLKDDEFLDMVNSIDKIRHANVVELMGYCAEHGQRLLIYEYCGNGTLQDALHADDEFKDKFAWNTRIRMTLGAARALEYLHEFCEPPIIHRNFKSANILLDDDLAVHVSDCGLAPLISSGSVSQTKVWLHDQYRFTKGLLTFRGSAWSSRRGGPRAKDRGRGGRFLS